MDLLFVGEKRSGRAKLLDLRWSSGGLAAKPLFAALRANGINPEEVSFANWFERGGKTFVRLEAKRGVRIYALGYEVQHALRKARIDYIPLIHPAARGAIRRRENYIAHVSGQLGLEF